MDSTQMFEAVIPLSLVLHSALLITLMLMLCNVCDASVAAKFILLIVEVYKAAVIFAVKITIGSFSIARHHSRCTHKKLLSIFIVLHVFEDI
jgi:positive regulator of sigma E activity